MILMIYQDRSHLALFCVKGRAFRNVQRRRAGLVLLSISIGVLDGRRYLAASAVGVGNICPPFAMIQRSGAFCP